MTRMPAAESPGEERARYVLTTLEVLHPPPCEVIRGNATAGPRDYLALPALDRPRLVVPTQPRVAIRRALGSFKTGSTRRERLRNAVLGWGLALGAGRFVGDRVTVRLPPGSDPSLDSELSSVLGCPVVLALYVGPQRAVEKPVAQVIDRSGALVGFAKLGVSPISRALVTNECGALSAVADLRTVRVPRLLHWGEVGRSLVMVQEPLRTRARREIPDALLQRAMLEIAESSGVRVAELGPSPYASVLRGRIESVEPHWAERLGAAFDGCLDVLAGTPLPFGAWHGDFAPWNMGPDQVDPDRLAVWDWEHYAEPVPVGFDAIHHAMATDLVDKSRTAAQAAESLGRGIHRRVGDLFVGLQLPRPPAAVCHAVLLLYFIEIGCRYLEDGEQEAVTRAGRIQTWLTGALETELESIRSIAG